jgi:hypothetical protein
MILTLNRKHNNEFIISAYVQKSRDHTIKI